MLPGAGGAAALRALPLILHILSQLRCPFSSPAVGCAEGIMLVMGNELR